MSFSTGVIPTTSFSRPQLKSNRLEDRVMHNNGQGKKQEVEEHRRNFKFSNNKTSVTECNDSLNAKTSNVNFVCITCGKCFYGLDLYSITLQDTTSPNLICLMAKATSSQAWLWHHPLSHLNFDTINLLSKYDIMTGLPKLKFVKDNLCSSCKLRKAKRIEHHTSIARTPEQNGVVERRNHTLVEAARTMISVAKTPYHITNGRKPSVTFFRIFGFLCYIIRAGESLDKMKEKGDACIFVGYSTTSMAYRVYNMRTRLIVETIHINFDKLPLMASDYVSFDLVSQCSTTELKQDSSSPNSQCQENVPHALETVTMSNGLDLLFSLMFDELLNETTPVVSKSSIVPAADAPNKH
nr:hypothetical protein [Tanacetum cinerariifolium]